MNKLFLLLVFLPLAIGIMAQTTPDFDLTDSDGKDHKLYADYLDQDKVVFIEFMFIGCPPCAEYLPFMNDLYTEYDSGNGDVEFFQMTVFSFDNNDAMAGYKAQNDIEFPMIGSDGGALDVKDEYSNGSYGTFLGTPTFAIIDAQGTVTLMRPSGSIPTWNDELRDSINAAINIAPPPPPPPPAPTFTISGTVLRADGQLWQSLPNAPNIVIQLNGDTSLLTTSNPFTFENISEGMDVELSALVSQDDPLNGVTTFDLIVISQHILGISNLELPLQIAADINCSGSITTFDIIALRQLILFITEALPCKSYLGVPSTFFEDPNAVLIQDIPSSITIEDLNGDHINQHFNMIKIGDLNQ